VGASGSPGHPRQAQSPPAYTGAGIDVDLPGVNLTDGLSRVSGNAALYRRILTKFREGQSGVVQAVRAARQAGDTELAVRLAHTLKGVAGNIGAKVLFAAANDLEQALKNDPEADIEPLLAGIDVQLEPLLSAIAALDNQGATDSEASSVSGSAEAESGAAGEVDYAALEPLLKNLDALLQRSNTKASAVVEEMKPLLSGTEGEAVLAAIAKAIGDYDFDAAIDRCSELASLCERGLDGK
jgi:HPt (histidine-containing phosphotransfer) domain-containing protein